MKRLAPLIPLLLSMALAGAAQAQETTVIQAENVRYAYAQVLRVTPVYQTLTATRMEQQCDQTPRPADEDSSKFSRVVGAVRDAWRRNQTATEEEPNCRSVPVEREFRRPIAYDVDYTYRGAKYRSRLPEDPGNRLRIRVSVVPAVAGARVP
jgi:uncharacterized protein YcfJ